MRSWLQRTLLLLVSLGVASLTLVTPAPPASTNPIAIVHLTYEPTPGSAEGANPGLGIPPDCSSWHELYPTFCAPHHQSGYVDNGDGVVSPCDFIYIDGVCCHIQWVGPTYYLSPVSGSGRSPILEPRTTNPGETPVCETWHEIYPDYCSQWHVVAWDDAHQNGQLDVCDVIQLSDGGWYHIDRIALNITVAYGVTGTQKKSLGQIKKLYRK
jgi:hypothetical protein